MDHTGHPPPSDRSADYHRPLDHSSLLEAEVAYLEAHLGPVETVFHELVPGSVRVDALIVGPAEERPFRTLVTCGMAERAMVAPEGLEPHRFAELLLCLASDWPLSQEATADEASYWPLRLLKRLARLPHDHETWLWARHTVPNGDPPERWAPGTDLCAVVLAPPQLVLDGFGRFDADGVPVQLLAVVPLHEDELRLKLDCGGDRLLERLRSFGVNELLDPRRQSVAPASWESRAEEAEVYRIVPALKDDDERLCEAQAKMARSGVGADDADNGVWLTPTVGETVYTARYYRELRQRLDSAETHAQVASALKGIRTDLHAGIFPY